jgi:predicted RNase H-like HicB family nuclease
MIKSKQAKIKIVMNIYGCKNMKLRVILEPSDEGGYTVYVPSLPGCISEGENVDEALANIKEAIELYLEPIENEFSLREGIIVRELVL